MQYNNEYKSNYLDINECTSRGACSVSPTIAALEELSLSMLQYLAYYILKLKEFGASNSKIRYEIINVLASLVSINEFSENQLYSIILKEYFMLNEAKKTYLSLCKKLNSRPKELKSCYDFSSSTPISQAISIGEKIFLDKYKKRSSGQKNLVNLLQIIIKSVSLNLIKLSDFEEFDDDIYNEILKTLDLFNHKKITLPQISHSISELAQMDNTLQLRISSLLLKSFGGISKVKVSHSSRKGKAILVSGNNFFDLLKILDETRDKDIDIYTHSNLLITHALRKFNEYENFRGHYGDNTENCILDFATFPGSILLTKNSRNNTEYLYRGRLFSNDYIVPNGVIKIENDDYTELIETTLKAKGFSKGKNKEESNLGYDESEIDSQLDDLVENLNSGKVNKLYIVGIDAHLEVQKEYFNDLFDKLKDDEFVLSFSYESDKDNVLTINIGNYVPLAANILHKLFNKFPISDNRVVFFFTTCDVMTISSIITLKTLDAKNIYMIKCPPTLVNPSVFDTFTSKYGLQTTSKVNEDLAKIRQNKSTQ